MVLLLIRGQPGWAKLSVKQRLEGKDFLYYVSYVYSVRSTPRLYISALITPSTEEQSAHVYSESKKSEVFHAVRRVQGRQYTNCKWPSELWGV